MTPWHMAVHKRDSTDLHVRVVGGIQVLPQRAGTVPLAPVRVISLGEDDPRAPADLVEVHLQVDPSTERLVPARPAGPLGAPGHVLPLTPLAAFPLAALSLLVLGGGPEPGLLGRVQ